MHCLPRILIHAHLGKHIPYYILNAGYPQFSYMRIWVFVGCSRLYMFGLFVHEFVNDDLMINLEFMETLNMHREKR